MSHVVVVGSLNADLTLYAERMPLPGETVLGTDFVIQPGGKSANQAVAAARLGADVRLIGAVGDDANGAMLLDSARNSGVDVSAVRRIDGVPTGVAGITVDAQGENSIVIVAGANGELSPQDVEQASSVFDGAAAVCLCLEVSQETVLAAARAGRAAGASVILNLSPFAPIPADLVAATDILLVNAHEAGQLLGREAPAAEGEDWAAVAAAFAEAGFRRVLVTLGAQGVVVLDGAGSGDDAAIERIAATRIEPVDTTGSGDAFTGGLAARLAAGDSLMEAARYASVAAAHAATGRGAQASYGTDADVVALRDR
ncbi:ribokinase [Arthrobacter woluwensis]|uniref:Ribokinase n=1 Tax=Arthrobacter woluwensis TaxID=156980 RepID=A0A1H4JGY7_9MICC|nr:ribokinase [Arthrobacter woluwensis]SEB45543.1 ribokinase [Arthrobacter woluwensis]